MICVAALIVFAILAIFSAKYRPLAKEAFDCVFRKITLRPCQSGLDRRVRVAAMMPFMKRTPKLAKAVYNYFPIISWAFVILTLLSLVYLVYGGYNFALYGNCNGPGSDGFCVFDPNGAGSSEVPECSEIEKSPESILIPNDVQVSNFKTLNPQGQKTVVFFGCYSCPYTRKGAEDFVEVIEKHPEVKFIVIDFPLSQHANSTLAANAGNCVYDEQPAAYLSYAKLLFNADLTQGLPDASMLSATAINFESVSVCAQKEHPRVTAGIKLGKELGIYGTPTYFIGGKAYVGPLNERSLEKLIAKS